MYSNDPLEDIIMSMSDHTTDAGRPFTGQSHTDQGERGKTEIKGLRFRDLADCIVRAFIGAAGFTLENADEMYQRAEDGTLNYNDLYELDLGEMDPLAVVQNVCCEVEKVMGIYPNVPKLHSQEDFDDP
jgi:hypothetical protein